MFWFVICDWNIRVVVGMGAQGLFILGFSLSVEVIFTFLSESFLVHILQEIRSIPSDCWNARRPSLLAVDLLQSPCCHFHPHSLCHWPGLRSFHQACLRLCLCVFVFAIGQVSYRWWQQDCLCVCQYAKFVNMPHLLICQVCWFATFVDMPHLSIYHVCQSSPRHY